MESGNGSNVMSAEKECKPGVFSGTILVFRASKTNTNVKIMTTTKKAIVTYITSALI
jgi:hypothetical protein